MARGGFMFRIGKKIKIGMKVSIMEVIDSSIHFEIPMGTLQFTFGGEVVMRLKVGSKESYPTLTVSMGYNLAIQRVELDGHMEKCWSNAFGVKGLEICDVILGAGIGAVPPFLTRFALGGAVTFGKHKFVFGVRMDLAAPAKAAFICHYKGELSVTDLIGVGVGIASKASGKSISMPKIPFPLFTLYELKIKISAGFFKNGGETFWPGYTFEAKFKLFGVDMYAMYNIGYNGILAEFRSKRISLLDGKALQICKDPNCKPEEGPSMKLEIKLIPPKFNIQMSGFASVLGATFGAIVDVQWQVNKAFKANFTAYPIELGCKDKKCALRIVASSQQRSVPPPRVTGAPSPRAATSAARCTSSVVESPPYSSCTASSVWSNDKIGVSHGTGRLDSAQAWSARTNAKGQWWQIDAGSAKQVVGVRTQGRSGGTDNQRVTAYKVLTSLDGSTWTAVDGGKVFKGNEANSNTVVATKFSKPVTARYVRIIVESWKHHVSMRAALDVCKSLEQVDMELDEAAADARGPSCVLDAGKKTSHSFRSDRDLEVQR